jgi:hypothetical protein
VAQTLLKDDNRHICNPSPRSIIPLPKPSPVHIYKGIYSTVHHNRTAIVYYQKEESNLVAKMVMEREA